MDFEAALIRGGPRLQNKALDAGEIGHRGERGIVRENCLREALLEGLLAQGVGIGSGSVLGANGLESLQTDIILYDPIVSPVFLERAVE